MKYDPQKHHRRSIRLKGYDYSQAGAYFVTICTQNRECLFGDIVDGEMMLNDAGQMVEQCWYDIPLHFPHAGLDEFVVMPNHIHGIVVINANVGAKNVGAKNFSPLLNKPHLLIFFTSVIVSLKFKHRRDRYDKKQRSD